MDSPADAPETPQIYLTTPASFELGRFPTSWPVYWTRSRSPVCALNWPAGMKTR